MLGLSGFAIILIALTLLVLGMLVHLAYLHAEINDLNHWVIFFDSEYAAICKRHIQEDQALAGVSVLIEDRLRAKMDQYETDVFPKDYAPIDDDRW